MKEHFRGLEFVCGDGITKKDNEGYNKFFPKLHNVVFVLIKVVSCAIRNGFSLFQCLQARFGYLHEYTFFV